MNSIIKDFKQHIVCSKIDTIYRMASNFGGNIFGKLKLLHMEKFTLAGGP